MPSFGQELETCTTSHLFLGSNEIPETFTLFGASAGEFYQQVPKLTYLSSVLGFQ